MKKLKSYFKMMITAVICLAMSLVPGKKKGQAVMELVTGGQAFGKNKNGSFLFGSKAAGQGTTENTASLHSKITADMQRFRSSTMQRHVFVPTVGPGDRILPAYVPRGSDVKENEICNGYTRNCSEYAGSDRINNIGIHRAYAGYMQADNTPACNSRLNGTQNGERKIIAFPIGLCEEKNIRYFQ